MLTLVVCYLKPGAAVSGCLRRVRILENDAFLEYPKHPIRVHGIPEVSTTYICVNRCTQYGSIILPAKLPLLPGLSRQKRPGLSPATSQIEACQNHDNACQCTLQYKAPAASGGPVWSLKLAWVGTVLACLGLSRSWLGPLAFAG